MIEINGTTIKMTRGDTFVATVTMRDKATKQEYTPETGDVIRFAMKRKRMTLDKGEYTDSQPLLTKAIPNNTLKLELNTQDTKSLKFGTYAYDIQLTYSNGTVDTFLSGDFIILPEVE